MKRVYLYSALIALVVSLVSIGAFKMIQGEQAVVKIEHMDSSPTKGVVYSMDDGGRLAPLDFVATSAKVVEAVVHIRSTQTRASAEDSDALRQLPNPFREFFGDRFPDGDDDVRMRPRVGTGSGVIINDQGYIVTNNHVINNSDDVEVMLYDNRSYKAKVIGTDPTTDLALLRIDQRDLPYLAFVNSDEVNVGEWVLAVGNPFSLNSTVTAGIVSAKGRNISINRERFAVESFIQTDAAINPGNSGGALVNLHGGLVGINTAIASRTGSYSGYGFAVPSNIVNKVVEDILKFGSVQRGVLGVMIRSVNGNLADQMGIDRITGVYVDSLLTNSAAGTAGIRPGDVIIQVDGQTVKTSPELQELIARKRPGDQVEIVVDRDGREKSYEVVLNSTTGSPELAAVSHKEVNDLMGASLVDLDPEVADDLGLSGGVQVKELYPGRLKQQTRMREGFIITKVDGRSVRDLDDLESALRDKEGGVMIEGRYPDREGTQYFAFGLDS